MFPLPLITNPVPVIVAARSPLDMSRLPANELEPVPEPSTRAVVVRLPLAWTPLAVLILPSVNELEAPWTNRLPPILAILPISKLVEMEAAPTTWKVVVGFVVPIPTLPDIIIPPVGGF